MAHDRSHVPTAGGHERPLWIALALTGAILVGFSMQTVAEEDADVQTIVVTATRLEQLVSDEPIHMEVVPEEEIEENLTVQPGNLSTLLNELPGVRVQSAAPGLGGAGLQLRGMPARHTVVLIDGLPLLGAEPDAFGLLQTPPLDLARVEVIKGAASALYGGAALGGVLNLVSQTADAEPGILANFNSRGGRDLVGFFTAKGASSWSGTLTAGAHDQSREDVDGDGWADLPRFRRFTLRPRVWWNGGQGRSLFLTAGIVDENRAGGTLPGRLLPDGAAFPEALRTRRFDGGAVNEWRLTDNLKLSGRLSLTSTHLDRTFGAQRIDSTQTTVFGEEALSGNRHGHAWVVGLAFERDELAVSVVPGVGYTYNVPAIFVQDEFTLTLGGGFAAPTPFVDEIEATGLGTLAPLRGLHAERVRTASLDAKWADEGWDVNASLFISEIRDPLKAQSAPGQKFELVNAPDLRRVPGAEALIRYVTGPLQLIASWSYLDATEVLTAGLREDAPRVPRHSAELAGRRNSHFLNAVNLTNVRQTHFDPLIRPTPSPGGNPVSDVWASLGGRTFNLGIKTEL